MSDEKPVWQEHVDRGVELLQLCSDLQSEKDGVDRPLINSVDKSKTLDQFAMDIQRAATFLTATYKLIPMMNDLAALGRKLEDDGFVEASVGDDYSRVALNYFLQQSGIEPSTK